MAALLLGRRWRTSNREGARADLDGGSARTPLGDDAGDARGVAPHAVNHRGRHGVLKMHSHEVKTRLIQDHAAVVTRFSALVEDGQLDETVASVETGAPDHVRDVEHA